MRDYSKPVKPLIRKYSGELYERELHRELTRLDEQFDRWRRGEIDSFELENLIHKFHQGPSRELYKTYTQGFPDHAVAYGIVTELLNESEIEIELLDELAQTLEFYRGMKARGELRMPGET